MSWNSRFVGQWSPGSLYSAERISIGSRYTIRGFNDDSLSGDIGAYIRNDLSLTQSLGGLSAVLADSLGSVQFFVGYDVGIIRQDNRDEHEGGTLQGLALGARTTGPLVLDITAATPLMLPPFSKKTTLSSMPL